MEPRVRQLLLAAEDRIFSCGVGDTAEELCRANMSRGLAKLLWVEEGLCCGPRAAFLGAPDATVTRNRARWASGFGYGGLVTWAAGVMPIEIKPNGCGVLMGLLDEWPKDVQARVRAVSEDPGRLEDVDLVWDVERSNHFLLLCEPDHTRPWQLPWKGPVFVLHSSGPEMRGPGPWGPGLYWDRSEELAAWSENHETPLGPFRILTGHRARAYWQATSRIHEFQMARREHLAKRLFGSYRRLFHGMHQGLLNATSMVLGAYRHDRGRPTRFFLGPEADWPLVAPLPLRPGLPVPLVAPKPSLRLDVLARLGWRERAERTGLRDPLTHSDLLPHGAGVAFPNLSSPRLEDPVHGRFSARSQLGEQIRFTSSRDLPYAYRGEEVLARTEALGLGSALGWLRVAWWVGGAAA